MSGIGNTDESQSSTSSSNSSSNSSICDTLRPQNVENDNPSTDPDVRPNANSSAPVRNQCYNSNANDNESNTPRVIQNNISIQNINAPIHIGPTYNLTAVQTKSNSGNSDGSCNASRKKSLSPKEKEHIRTCWISKRVIHDDEVLAISKNIGKHWKDVGNALKFNFVRIEKWEQEAKQVSEDDSCAVSDAVYRMLYFWVQWKDEKATVGRLAKALYNSDELDAFECLQP